MIKLLSHINTIIYHIQTNDGIRLSDKSRWDIESNVMNVLLEKTLDAKKEMEYWRCLYIKEKYGRDLPKIYDIKL